MRRALLLFFVLVACAAGCAPPTEILVTVQADEQVRARARFVRVSVYAGLEQADALSFRREARLVAVGGLAPEVRFPTIVPLHPGSNGSDSELFTFVAEGLDHAGQEPAFVIAKFVTSFSPRRARSLTLWLEAQCIDVRCEETTDACREGTCVPPEISVDATEISLPSDAQPAGCDPDGVCSEHPRPGPRVFDTCATATDAFVSTSYGILRRGADAAWRTERPYGANLTSIACWDDGRAIAVGQGGVILERAADGMWLRADSTTSVDLSSVEGASATDAWAIGADATILHRGAEGWSAVTAPDAPAIDLLAISADGARVVVGAREDTGAGSGRLFERTSEGWQELTLPRPRALNVVTFTDTLLIQQGIELHEQVGEGWSSPVRPSCGSFAELTALAGAPDGRALAGGGRGGVWSRDTESRWSCDSPIGGVQLRGAAIAATAASPRGYLAHGSGLILAWDGMRITQEGARVFAGTLRDVVVDPLGPARYLAVGGTSAALIAERVAPDLWRQRAIVALDDARVLTRVLAREELAVAVGTDGLIVERDALRGWRAVERVGPSLRALDERGGRWVAGGDAATLLERVDGVWRAVEPPLVTEGAVHAVALAEDGSLWVGTGSPTDDARCDGQGALHRLQGGLWETLAAAIPCAVTELALEPGGAPWVGADRVHRWESGALVPQSRRVDGSIRRLWIVEGAIAAVRDDRGVVIGSRVISTALGVAVAEGFHLVVGEQARVWRLAR